MSRAVLGDPESPIAVQLVYRFKCKYKEADKNVVGLCGVKFENFLGEEKNVNDHCIETKGEERTALVTLSPYSYGPRGIKPHGRRKNILRDSVLCRKKHHYWTLKQTTKKYPRDIPDIDKVDVHVEDVRENESKKDWGLEKPNMSFGLRTALQ